MNHKHLSPLSMDDLAQLNEQKSGLQCVAKNYQYKSDWVSLRTDHVVLPSGKEICAYHQLEHQRESVTTVVYDVKLHILATIARRYTFDALQIEIPCGGIEVGESPLDAAQREVLEETGVNVPQNRMTYQGYYYPSNGMSNQKAHIVFAQLDDLTNITQKEFDEDEIVTVFYLTKSQVIRLLQDGVIRDGFACIALQKFLLGQFMKCVDQNKH